MTRATTLSAWRAETRLGDIIAGRYVIQARIGEGGFSSVYSAQDIATGALAAVKFLHVTGDMHAWQRRRFEKEMDHAGIVRLLDTGWVNHLEPYLVMSFVEGPTLRAVLRRGTDRSGAGPPLDLATRRGVDRSARPTRPSSGSETGEYLAIWARNGCLRNA